MRLRTRKTSTVLLQPVSRKQEEEEEEMRAKSKHTHQDLSLQQSLQDMPQTSRVEKAEEGLFVVQSPQNQQKLSSRTKSIEKVLLPLRDHPVTSAAAKANETGAPTLQTGLQEAKQTIEDQKKEIAILKDWVDTLKEERDFLRERLKEALAVRSDKGGDVASNIPPIRQAPGQRKLESNVTDSSSSNSSSDSEPDSESSGAKKAKKKKSHPKKAKKMGKKLRVKTPDDSIRRYNMVLEKIKKDHISKAEAYARLGVDRNTIVSQAPIAELAAANPDLFRTLRSTFKRKDSLKGFAETCRGFCEQEPTASAILKKKGDGSLLDIYKN
ncbi:coiled-coil domain-containing protein 106-like [Clarias gariepinus]|uniref:coiled-coil domain-containing protein 106-like n=1 Tax=Clarias gariepinus TaxID=13013 RepID=UPI00234C05E8|nr:coiled-coil domain-containing protein 106-like [Clarias gariepinus]